MNYFESKLSAIDLRTMYKTRAKNELGIEVDASKLGRAVLSRELEQLDNRRKAKQKA